MKINKYPDGSTFVDISSINPNNKIVFKINSYEDLWHLNQLVDAYNYSFEEIPTIVIPNLIDAQADRRFSVNQSSGLKLVCKFLNKMKANFKIFHPHNPEVIEALMDNVKIVDNSEFIKEVIYNKLYFGSGFPNPDMYNNLILMSSDAGGFKPLMGLCDKIQWKGHTESASKYRNPQNSKLIQIIDKQDFGGRDILIIDDICVYGGTFKGLSKMLRERNCGKLYLAVSHMTVQDLGEDPVTNYFDIVFTTNSKYDNYYTLKNLYLSSDDEGNEHMVTEKAVPKNLEIIKLF